MRRFVILAAAVALGACAREDAGMADTTAGATAAAAPAVPQEVQHALAVEQGVAANPGKADSVLAAHGLTAAGFDSLMYRIAGDSSLRAAMAQARR